MTDLEMCTSIRLRDIDLIKKYLDEGFNVNKYFRGKPFIFHILIFTETLDILKLFIDFGANLYILNNNIIDYIIKSKLLGLDHLEYKLVEYIYNYYIIHNYDFEFNIEHIYLIIQHNRLDIYNLFNNLPDFKNLVNNHKQELFLENLKYNNCVSFFDYFFDINNLNYRNINNETLLHICLNNKNYDYAKYLIEKDSNDTMINDNNNYYLLSPLMLCCQLINDNKRIDIFNILINKSNIDVNKICFRGHDALMYACQYNNLDIINKLIEKGANLSHINNEGNNALIISCMWENLNVAKLLIANGMNILFENNKAPKNCKRCIDYLMSKKDRLEFIKLANIPFDLYLTYYILSF